jgi:hypothetical protein
MGQDRRSKGHSQGARTHNPHLVLACVRAFLLSHPLPGTHGCIEASTLTHKPQVHAHPHTPLLLIRTAQSTLPQNCRRNTGKGIHAEVDEQVIRSSVWWGCWVGGGWSSKSESRKKNSVVAGRAIRPSNCHSHPIQPAST